MSDFTLPSLGADMDSGKVVEWLVKPGDTVTRGSVIVLVETEKGVIEVEIWEDATIGEILVPEGETVPVGTPIARLGEPEALTPGEEEAEAVEEEIDATAPAQEAAAAPEMESGTRHEPRPVPPPPVRHLAHELAVAIEEIDGTGPDGTVTREDVRQAARRRAFAAGAREPRIMVSPLARRLAGELGVDLAGVVGSGPDGVITRDDVEHAATGTRPPSREERRAADESRTAREVVAEVQGTPQQTGTGDRSAQQAAMRHAIAQVMARSKREIPHYYLGTTVDMSTALGWLEEHNRERPVTERILPAALLLKASALAIRQVPEVNGFFEDGEYRPSDGIHLGVAISLRSGGLIAPAIHDADRMSLDDLMAALRDLVQRTRTGRLRSSEMSDPTITITNLGDRGVEEVFPVIYAPQVAIVGFGKVTEQPVARDGLLGIRPVVRATLAADHRVSDGHRGGLYLAAVDGLLQEPEGL
jgi:pyruvate dehydrogenase E2 component (dihydrolipoamide acetyltransferase)